MSCGFGELLIALDLVLHGEGVHYVSTHKRTGARERFLSGAVTHSCVSPGHQFTVLAQSALMLGNTAGR